MVCASCGCRLVLRTPVAKAVCTRRPAAQAELAEGLTEGLAAGLAAGPGEGGPDRVPLDPAGDVGVPPDPGSPYGVLSAPRAADAQYKRRAKEETKHEEDHTRANAEEAEPPEPRSKPTPRKELMDIYKKHNPRKLADVDRLISEWSTEPKLVRRGGVAALLMNVRAKYLTKELEPEPEPEPELVVKCGDDPPPSMPDVRESVTVGP